MILNSEILKICSQEIIKPINAGACNFFVDAVAKRLGFGNMFTGMNAASMYNAFCKGFNTRKPKAGSLSPFAQYESLDELMGSNALAAPGSAKQKATGPMTIDDITKEYFDNTEAVCWHSLQRNYAAAVELAQAGHFVIAATGNTGGHGHVAIIVGGEPNKAFGMMPNAYWGRYLQPEKAGSNDPISHSWRESALKTDVMCFSTPT